MSVLAFGPLILPSLHGMHGMDNDEYLDMEKNERATDA
jgi:hypothetical protein